MTSIVRDWLPPLAPPAGRSLSGAEPGLSPGRIASDMQRPPFSESSKWESHQTPPLNVGNLFRWASEGKETWKPIHGLHCTTDTSMPGLKPIHLGNSKTDTRVQAVHVYARHDGFGFSKAPETPLLPTAAASKLDWQRLPELSLETGRVSDR